MESLPIWLQLIIAGVTIASLSLILPHAVDFAAGLFHRRHK